MGNLCGQGRAMLMNEEGGYLIPSIIEYPENKFEAFKERYFPQFMKRIFPVKVKQIDFKKRFLEIMKEERKKD